MISMPSQNIGIETYIFPFHYISGVEQFTHPHSTSSGNVRFQKISIPTPRMVIGNFKRTGGGGGGGGINSQTFKGIYESRYSNLQTPQG